MSTPAPKPRILVVDDEPGFREMLAILFRREGLDVTLAPGFRTACDAVTRAPTPYALVLTDLLMPDGSGMDLLSIVKEHAAATEVIVMTAHGGIDSAIDAMKRGAYDFLTKPFATNELRALVHKALEKRAIVAENERLRAQVVRERGDTLIANSEPMRRVLDIASRVAATKSTVLITGESGTGKERIARAIHAASDRQSRPMLVINCGAIPEALMESELFGHERGSFTGAIASRLGIFREADGGTVMLDEVGDLPAPLQVKLLRVLQERKVRSVGAASEAAVDVRLIAATNRNVEDDVRTGRFRQDLYYRLNIIRIEMPPSGSAARTSARSPSISCVCAPPSRRRRCEPCRPTPCARWMRTPSRATCASSRTSSSAPSLWPPDRRSDSATFRARCPEPPPSPHPGFSNCRTPAATSTTSSASSNDGFFSRPSSAAAAFARRRPNC
jgi:two-component system response regulator PilR (NtrC family)